MRARATGRAFCPTCGESVEYGADVYNVRREDGGLWVQLYDAKPRHRCRKEARKG